MCVERPEVRCRISVIPSVVTSASILTMRLVTYISHSFLILGLAPYIYAASSWSFDDATLSIQGKKAGVGGSLKEKYMTVQLIKDKADFDLVQADSKQTFI